MDKERKVSVKEPKESGWRELWYNFINPQTSEETPEEIILKSKELSPEQKKELIASLKGHERILNRMFKNSYKTSVEVVKDHKKSAEQALKDSKTLKDKNTQNNGHGQERGI